MYDVLDRLVIVLPIRSPTMEQFGAKECPDVYRHFISDNQVYKSHLERKRVKELHRGICDWAEQNETT